MRINLFLLVLTFLTGMEVCTAQGNFRAGMSSVSIEPGDESFSVALAGYAGPWVGRFAVQWNPEGVLSSNPRLARQVKRQGIVKEEGVQYRLSQQGLFEYNRTGSRREGWEQAPSLKGLKSFVVQHPYVYGCNGTDTLYKFHIDNPRNGWNRALYFNGVIRKVNIQHLYTHNRKLFAVNESDSLFSAPLIHGQKEEHSYARAVAIQNGDAKVLIICMDLCGFNSDMIDNVKASISGKTGLPAEAILINASHTHFVPGTQRWIPWAPHNRYPDVNYMEKVVKPAMIKAGVEASSKLFPVRLSFGRGTTTIGANRRNPGSTEPYDNAVDVLRIVSTDEKKQAVLVLTGCHPVFGTKGIRHFTISSNYPGFMRSAVEKNAATPTMALFMQGCAGDINPVDEPEVSGAKLAGDVMKVLNTSMTELSGGIDFKMDSLLIPTNPMSISELEEFRAKNVALGPEMEPERDVAWADLMLSYHRDNKMPKYMPIYIQTLNIGQWKLIGMSREVVTEYSLAIKKIWPGKMVSVAGYCNDVSSYLPVARHIRAKVYEGEGSYFWYGMPSPFPLDILDRVVNRIQSKAY
ncbi:MAG: hypothetical protein ABS46_06180 [Cytophagaceae bacterium SCN 52-12]|nr:MAG: hypothetical protein ABS46_06180 [Cytophagaceae bacterium SCN 52-12]